MKKETANLLDRVCIEAFGVVALLIWIAIFGITRHQVTIYLYTFISLIIGYLLGKVAMAAQLIKKEKLKNKSKKRR